MNNVCDHSGLVTWREGNKIRRGCHLEEKRKIETGKKIPVFLATFHKLRIPDIFNRHSPGSSVHGIPWARILEWVAIPFSRDSSQPRDQTRVTLITGGLFTAEPPGKPKTFTLCDNIFSPSQYISFWACPYDYIKVLQSQPESCR